MSRPKKNRKNHPTPASLRDQILADFTTLRVPVTADQLDVGSSAGLRRDTAVVTICTLVSRVSGFGRVLAVAAVLGSAISLRRVRSPMRLRTACRSSAFK